MKTLFPLLFGCSFIIACSDPVNNQISRAATKQKNISTRDRGINSSNSYSDLFLDSIAIEKFMSEKKSPIRWLTASAAFIIHATTNSPGLVVMA